MAESSKLKKKVKMLNLKFLRISLKYRPEILKLIMKMRHQIKNKNVLIKQLTLQLKKLQKQITTEDTSTQTDKISEHILDSTDKVLNTTNEAFNSDNNSETTTSIRETLTGPETNEKNDVEKTEAGWNTEEKKEGKSIAEQVKEAAQSALQQSGMVYVDSVGMYYDYKTGYYYNSELGLYYHTDTDCYYYYSEEKQTFVFHSYPNRTVENTAFVAHEKRKARKHKLEKKKEDDIDNLTKNLSQGNEDAEVIKPKRKKKMPKKTESTEVVNKDDNVDLKLDSKIDVCQKRENESHSENKDIDSKDANENKGSEKEVEDGECSDTSSESDSECDDSNGSTSTASDDDSIAKQHPPCMRVIVRETNLPKLKVGSLFLVTKDGGTIGREGDHHTIIIKDHNVSRNHLDIKYDMIRKTYTVTDLGSKNGTVLNGTRMTESQVVSVPMEIMHGSTMQLGETKLLCHIHPGNDTCGHCEPGLLMETEDEKKIAYTRTCSVQKQHQLELARLKNKYAPKQLSIEATAYNDRAQARRDAVGSSHHSEKTKSSDLNTSIEPENKGFKLLEKMGWSKGEGLGKDNQGDTEPVPLISNEGKAGLGTLGTTGTPPLVPTKAQVNSLGKATLRLANRTKMLNPPAKAFQEPVDDEQSE